MEKWLRITVDSMNEQLAEALKDSEGANRAFLNAVIYADQVMRRYPWRGQKVAVSRSKALIADGKTAEDFVSDTFEKLTSGDRAYREDKSLLDNLKSAVESLISSHRKPSKRKNLVDYPPVLDEEGREFDPIVRAMDLSTSAEAREEQWSLEQQQKCFDSIKTSLDGDPDLQKILEGIVEGFSPAEIAELNEWKVEKVYELNRKLKKHVHAQFAVQNYEELERKIVLG